MPGRPGQTSNKRIAILLSINKLCIEHVILVDQISGQFRDRQNICDKRR